MSIPFEDEGFITLEIPSKQLSITLDLVDAHDAMVDIHNRHKDKDSTADYIADLRAWFEQRGFVGVSLLTMGRMRDAIRERTRALLGKDQPPASSGGPDSPAPSESTSPKPTEPS